MNRLGANFVVRGLVVGFWMAPGPAAAGKIQVEPNQRYLILSTVKTSTMEQELKEAAALGFHIIQSSPNGAGLALLLARNEEAEGAYRYELLSTTKVGTMEGELQRYSEQGYRLLPRSIIGVQRPLLMGGPQVICIVEQPPQVESHYEYKVLGTNLLATLQKEIMELEAQGFHLVGFAIASGHTVVMERQVPAMSQP